MTVEPVSSTRPRFATDSKLVLLERTARLSLSLACPGQGFPVPSFRLEKKGDDQSFNVWSFWNFN